MAETDDKLPSFVVESGPQSFRRRAHDFVELGSFAGPVARAFELVMITLIVVNVIAVALETVPSLAAAYDAVFHAVELVSIGLFSVEYLLRLWVAPERSVADATHPWRARLRYIFSPLALIDLLAVLPFYFLGFGELRILRLFRLVRLLKLVRYSPALSSLARVLFEERRALLAALVIMVGVLFAAATMLYLIEGGLEGSPFATIPGALWWALATLTTVGYGDVVPATPLGKVAGGFVMLFGLAFYALPIGIMASGFTDELRRRQFLVPIDVLRKMALFKGVDDAALADVASRMRTLAVSPGSVLAHRREVDNGLYILIGGSANVMADGHTLLLGQGDFFGEYGILLEDNHQPAVIACDRARLLRLTSRDLAMVFALYPEIALNIHSLVHQRLTALVATGVITDVEKARNEHYLHETLPDNVL